MKQDTWCHICSLTALVPWHVNMMHHYISLQFLCPSWHSFMTNWMCRTYSMDMTPLHFSLICKRYDVCYVYFHFYNLQWVAATHHRDFHFMWHIQEEFHFQGICKITKRTNVKHKYINIVSACCISALVTTWLSVFSQCFTNVVKQVLATMLVCLSVHVCLCLCLSNCFKLHIVEKLYEENTLSNSLNNTVFH